MVFHERHFIQPWQGTDKRRGRAGTSLSANAARTRRSSSAFSSSGKRTPVSTSGGGGTATKTALADIGNGDIRGHAPSDVILKFTSGWTQKIRKLDGVVHHDQTQALEILEKQAKKAKQDDERKLLRTGGGVRPVSALSSRVPIEQCLRERRYKEDVERQRKNEEEAGVRNEDVISPDGDDRNGEGSSSLIREETTQVLQAQQFEDESGEHDEIKEPVKSCPSGKDQESDLNVNPVEDKEASQEVEPMIEPTLGAPDCLFLSEQSSPGFPGESQIHHSANKATNHSISRSDRGRKVNFSISNISNGSSNTTQQNRPVSALSFIRRTGEKKKQELNQLGISTVQGKEEDLTLSTLIGKKTAASDLTARGGKGDDGSALIGGHGRAGLSSSLVATRTAAAMALVEEQMRIDFQLTPQRQMMRFAKAHSKREEEKRCKQEREDELHRRRGQEELEEQERALSPRASPRTSPAPQTSVGTLPETPTISSAWIGVQEPVLPSNIDQQALQDLMVSSSPELLITSDSGKNPQPDTPAAVTAPTTSLNLIPPPPQPTREEELAARGNAGSRIASPTSSQTSRSSSLSSSHLAPQDDALPDTPRNLSVSSESSVTSSAAIASVSSHMSQGSGASTASSRGRRYLARRRSKEHRDRGGELPRPHEDSTSRCQSHITPAVDEIVSVRVEVEPSRPFTPAYDPGDGNEESGVSIQPLKRNVTFSPEALQAGNQLSRTKSSKPLRKKSLERSSLSHAPGSIMLTPGYGVGTELSFNGRRNLDGGPGPIAAGETSVLSIGSAEGQHGIRSISPIFSSRQPSTHSLLSGIATATDHVDSHENSTRSVHDQTEERSRGVVDHQRSEEPSTNTSVQLTRSNISRNSPYFQELEKKRTQEGSDGNHHHSTQVAFAKSIIQSTTIAMETSSPGSKLAQGGALKRRSAIQEQTVKDRYTPIKALVPSSAFPTLKELGEEVSKSKLLHKVTSAYDKARESSFEIGGVNKNSSAAVGSSLSPEGREETEEKQVQMREARVVERLQIIRQAAARLESSPGGGAAMTPLRRAQDQHELEKKKMLSGRSVEKSLTDLDNVRQSQTFHSQRSGFGAEAEKTREDDAADTKATNRSSSAPGGNHHRHRRSLRHATDIQYIIQHLPIAALVKRRDASQVSRFHLAAASAGLSAGSDHSGESLKEMETRFTAREVTEAWDAFLRDDLVPGNNGGAGANGQDEGPIPQISEQDGPASERVSLNRSSAVGIGDKSSVLDDLESPIVKKLRENKLKRLKESEEAVVGADGKPTQKPSGSNSSPSEASDTFRGPMSETIPVINYVREALWNFVGGSQEGLRFNPKIKIGDGTTLHRIHDDRISQQLEHTNGGGSGSREGKELSLTEREASPPGATTTVHFSSPSANAAARRRIEKNNPLFDKRSIAAVASAQAKSLVKELETKQDKPYLQAGPLYLAGKEVRYHEVFRSANQ